MRVARLHADDPGARVVEELDLDGARADLVVLNGRIEGYEIKSDHDSLARLSGQADAYEAVCDRVWLVTTERFAAAAALRLPAWWGILVARRRSDGVVLVRRRAAKGHGKQRGRSLLELLWRRELVTVAERRAVEHHGSRATVRALRDAIAGSRASPGDLANDVREALLLREGWRAERPSASGDAPSRPSARWSGSRLDLPPHRRR